MTVVHNFPTSYNKRLSTLAVAFKNAILIGEDVVPSVLWTGNTNAFSYPKFNKKDGMTIPDTRIGNTGHATEVSFSYDMGSGIVADHGIITKISKKDMILSQGYNGVNINDVYTGKLRDVMLLRREVEKANAVFNAANYDSGNKVTLTSNDQFSDLVNSTPITYMRKVIEGLDFIPTHITMGSIVWYYLSSHPKMLTFVAKDASTTGYVTPNEFMTKFSDLLGINLKLSIGRAKVNTANIGLTPVLARAWENHIAFTIKDQKAILDASSVNTFADVIWAPDGMPPQQVYADELKPLEYGAMGGESIGIAEMSKVINLSTELGYLITNATVNTIA